MKIYIDSAGCTRRLAELASLRRYFEVNGHIVVNRPEDAEFILAATCAFKKMEEERSVERLKQLKEFGAELLVYGCLPEIAPAKFEEFKGTRFLAPKDISQVDEYFHGNKVKFADVGQVNVIPEKLKSSSLPTAVKKFGREFEVSGVFLRRATDYAGKKIKKTLHLDHKKNYLFVCRGCLGKCSYCAIRRAVGPLVSHEMFNILEQFDAGLAAGYRDYVILGDDVGAYGMDIKSTFPDLLNRLIDHADRHFQDHVTMAVSKKRIRFHIEEIHPKWMILYQAQLAEIAHTGMVSSILCPVQSGNNRILQLMCREHDVEDIRGTFTVIRYGCPQLKLSTQLLIGFPSETEEEFNDSLQFVNDVRFDEVTIFPFDPKEKTPASMMKPMIPVEIVERRINHALKYFKQHKIAAHLSCQN